MGTLTYADIYGKQTPGTKSQNAPPDTQSASGAIGDIGQTPVITWVGIIVILVSIRLLSEVLS